MSLLDALSKGYKGGSKSSPAPKLTPQTKPSPTITTEQMVEIENLVEKEKAEFILRGLRNPADFEFEKAIAHANRTMSKIETVFLLTAARTSFISSSIVRDVLRNGGDVSKMVPESVLNK